MLAKRNAGSEYVTPGKACQRGIGAVSVVSNIYHPRFCFANKRQVNTLPDVEKILNSMSQNEMQDSLEGLRLLSKDPEAISLDLLSNMKSDLRVQDRALTNQFENTHSLTNIQLLDALCTRVSEESYALNFDYFSFHKRCTLLLKSVYDEFKDEVSGTGGAELDWTVGELPVVPYWIFKMLEDEEKKAEVLERLSKVMKGIVVEEGSKEVFALREFLDGGRLGS